VADEHATASRNSVPVMDWVPSPLGIRPVVALSGADAPDSVEEDASTTLPTPRHSLADAQAIPLNVLTPP
jgi:hypothetical protein